jgi:hypothetical protein
MNQPTDADFRVVLATLLAKLAVTIQTSSHGQMMTEDIVQIIRQSFQDNNVVMPPSIAKAFGRPNV